MEDVSTTKVFRILLVEDDQERANILMSYLPKHHIREVYASSPGRELGIIKADHRNRWNTSPYCGIMLDQDLQEQIICVDEGKLSGMNVVEGIINYVSRHVPILVHSMNPSQASIMVKKLKSSGFRVTRMPMRELTREKLKGWLEEECESYNDNL